MGTVEKGELQTSAVAVMSLRPENPVEFVVSVLKIMARKDVGEPFGGDEREASRQALRLLGRDW